MSKGLPTRFVIAIGPQKQQYRVSCTIRRPDWVCPEGRDCFAMTRFAPKEIWVFRFKDSKRQLTAFGHEVGHAVVHEFAVEKQLGDIEEPMMILLVENLLVSLWNLGLRWPKWEVQALGANLIIVKSKPDKKRREMRD